MFKPSEVREWTDACGGRRFLLTLGCGVVNTGLVIFGVIDPTTYRDLTVATVAVYIAGNTYQRAKELASP